MHKFKSHEKWALPILVLLYLNTSLSAQCPDTKSATYALLSEGIPLSVPLQPSDFQVQPEDSSIFSNLTLSNGYFTCEDIGIQEVFLSGVNAQDESFSCGVNVWVYDSVQLCGVDMVTPRAIGGKIVTEKNEGVPDIITGLSNADQNYYRGTDEEGRFYFENFELEHYNLTPSRHYENNVLNGVSTLDVLFLQKYVLGLKSFDSPYKLLAADVNSSGEITAYDMLLLRQLILAVIDELPNTPSWKFVDANYIFDEAIDPLKQEIPTSISLDMTKLGPQLDNRFIAVKIGDLNNSVKLSTNNTSRANLKVATPIFSLENELLSKGETVEVPFEVAKNTTIQGLQFALKFDESKLSFLDITSDLPISDNNYWVENGLLTFSWTTVEQIALLEAAAPFKLTFIVKETTELTESINLSNTTLAAEIYSAATTAIPFSINWANQLEKADFQVFTNYPNPFTTNTTIPFYLPQSSTLTLQVFDAKGRIVLKEKMAFEAGFQAYQIEKGFDASGLYFYRLESDFGVAAGRMNFIGK